MQLKQIRKNLGLTQRRAAEILEISVRTYIKYENDPTLADTAKCRFLCRELLQFGLVDETHGILTKEQISDVCRRVFDELGNVDFCYLFGSYAKGNATVTSDVDLLISLGGGSEMYFEAVERLRTGLCKNVDLLTASQLTNNAQLTNEILKDGVKIYG